MPWRRLDPVYALLFHKIRCQSFELHAVISFLEACYVPCLLGFHLHYKLFASCLSSRENAVQLDAYARFGCDCRATSGDRARKRALQPLQRQVDDLRHEWQLSELHRQHGGQELLGLRSRVLVFTNDVTVCLADVRNWLFAEWRLRWLLA